MKADNGRSGKTLADGLVLAATLLHRMRGLLGKKGLECDEELWVDQISIE